MRNRVMMMIDEMGMWPQEDHGRVYGVLVAVVQGIVSSVFSPVLFQSDHLYGGCLDAVDVIF